MNAHNDSVGHGTPIAGEGFVYENEPLTTCPECNGKGYMEAFGCPGFKLIKVKCSFCRESGKVTRVDLLRKEEGRRMRDERVDRRISLREEAARLGIKPSELSDRERGILRNPQTSSSPDFVEIKPKETP